MGNFRAASPAKRRIIYCVCLIAELIILCSCSSSGGTSISHSRVVLPPALGQVPALGELPVRQPAATQVIDPAVPAAGEGMVSAGITLGATTTATAGAGVLEYVIYALGPYGALTQPRYLLLDLLSSTGSVWVGISNYASHAWEWSECAAPNCATEWVAVHEQQAFRNPDGTMFVAIAVYDGASLSFSGGSFVEDPPYSFTAQFRRIITEAEVGDGNIEQCIMSGDGQKVFTVNWLEGDGLVISMNADGTNVQSIPLPSTVLTVKSMAVNHDGSRLFVTDDSQYIYKIEGTSVTPLWVFEGTSYQVTGTLQCDAAGEYVYFGNFHSGGISDCDIWRASQAGVLELLVNDDTVTHATVPAATALRLGDPCVSDDGGVVVFDAYFVDPIYGYELYMLDGSGVHQLTTYANNSSVTPRAVSGDGSTIVFTRTGAGEDDKLYSIHPDGSGLTDLGLFSHNYQGCGIQTDGSRLVFADMHNIEGVLVNIPAATRYQLTTVNPVSLDILGPISMTSDGNRICFRHSLDGVLGVQIVDLNQPAAVPGVPQIEKVLFCPPQYVRTHPDRGVVIKATVNEPQGLDTVRGCIHLVLMDGLDVMGSSDGPIFWDFDPNDIGELNDAHAGDGIFTSPPGRPGALIIEKNQTTVRLAVQDEDGNAFLADTVLEVIGEPAIIE